MIKKLHEITIKDIVLLDATKSASHLKKYWFVPLWLYSKQLEKLAADIFQSIGTRSTDDIEYEIGRILAYSKIQILDALFRLINIEIKLKGIIHLDKLMLGKDYDDSEQFKKVLDEVHRHTGIQIETGEDLKRFNDHVEFTIDKYNEKYPKIETQKQEVKFIKIIYSVFSYMGEPYNENMRLVTFLEMKNMVEERINKKVNHGEESGDSPD